MPQPFILRKFIHCHYVHTTPFLSSSVGLWTGSLNGKIYTGLLKTPFEIYPKCKSIHKTLNIYITINNNKPVICIHPIAMNKIIYN